MKALVFLIAVFLAAPPMLAEPEYVYIKKDDTKIFSKPSFKAETLYKAKAGERVKVIRKKGKFLRVKTNKGVTGYVFRLRVTKDKPDSVSGAGSGEALEDKFDDKRSAAIDEEASSHSIRGREKEPGSGPKDDVEQLFGVLTGEGRATTMEDATSSHSIRGLKKAQRGKNGATEKEAEASVKSMGKFSVGANDLRKFQRDGKVGEYAGR